LAFFSLFSPSDKAEVTPAEPAPVAIVDEATIEPQQANDSSTIAINLPLNDALNRVTKKPFGIKISPATSPVQPERFSGYHSGTDFETFEAEAETEVPVYAICDGKVLVKQRVSGYGGVLIQSCNLPNVGLVTVLYGHLSLKSIGLNTGDPLSKGGLIGNLGKGYSAETDNERKHLHLSVHKGTAIEYRGYVQTEAELNGWIDPMTLI